MSRLTVLPCAGVILFLFSGLDAVQAELKNEETLRNEIFSLLTKDNTEKIDLAKFKKLINSADLLPTPAYPTYEFNKTNVNGGDYLNKCELNSFLSSAIKRLRVYLDKDENGSITADEYRQQAVATDEETDKFMKEYDSIEDGQVTTTEYLMGHLRYVLKSLKCAGV